MLADGRLPVDNTRAERSLRKVVVGRKNWIFYGCNSHAESAAAIFSLVASCRLHGLDPEQYFDEVMRALPDWPKDRYLELSPKHWRTTRGHLLTSDLESPLCAFTAPPAALNFAPKLGATTGPTAIKMGCVDRLQSSTMSVRPPTQQHQLAAPSQVDAPRVVTLAALLELRDRRQAMN